LWRTLGISRSNLVAETGTEAIDASVKGEMLTGGLITGREKRQKISSLAGAPFVQESSLMRRAKVGNSYQAH